MTAPQDDKGFALWWMAQKRKSLEQLDQELEQIRRMREEYPKDAA